MSLLIITYSKFITILNQLNPLLLLGLRLWMAHAFWVSGMVKIDDFENTIALFRDEYKTPFLSPELAAIFATSFELSCPILLVIGFATRLATLPLLAMTAVIQLTYAQNIEHFYWALLLGTILVSGAGKISLDYLIARKYNRRKVEY
ncbi:MAG: DoxX family protein [Rickettsiales bacterium]|jgi:putative oxidoreductase